jgi:putative protease
LGNTPYRATRIDIALSQDYFIPPSMLSTWRREAVEWLDRARRLAYRPDRRKAAQGTPQWLTGEVDYHANIANPVADRFYRSHGVTRTAPAFEIAQPHDGELMRTRYCIKYELGVCPVHQKAFAPNLPKPLQSIKAGTPLFLLNNGRRLALHFDCRNCEMTVKEVQSNTL